MNLNWTKLFITTFALFVTQSLARTLNVVTNSTQEIFVKSSGGNETIGFGFAIHSNVISVKLNATASNITDSGYTPISFQLAPLRILEFANLSVINDTTTGFPFLNSSTNSSLWANGLQSSQYQSDATNSSSKADVWLISANYTSSNHSGPDFLASFYITSEATTFQGLKLSPNAVTMLFTILNASQKGNNSTLGLDQLLISRRTLPQPFVTPFSNGTRLRQDKILEINQTASVDGTLHPILLFPISSSNDASLDKQVFAFDLVENQSERFVLAFIDSEKANNVTFEQRLIIDPVQLYCATCGGSNNTNSNPKAQSHSSLSMNANLWLTMIAVLLSLLLVSTLF